MGLNQKWSLGTHVRTEHQRVSDARPRCVPALPFIRLCVAHLDYCNVLVCEFCRVFWGFFFFLNIYTVHIPPAGCSAGQAATKSVGADGQSSLGTRLGQIFGMLDIQRLSVTLSASSCLHLLQVKHADRRSGERA